MNDKKNIKKNIDKIIKKKLVLVMKNIFVLNKDSLGLCGDRVKKVNTGVILKILMSFLIVG